MQALSTISNLETLDKTSLTKVHHIKKDVAVAKASEVQQDQYDSKAQKTDKKAEKNPLDGFDLDAFRAEIRAELLDMVSQSKKQAQATNPEIPTISEIPYNVMDNEVAAEVPEEWNADNTSQRIVDFALSFRSQASGLTDEEYIDQVRSAIQQGFKLAKEDLGGLPGPSAKLFNDTYDAAMKKLDKVLADWNANPGSSIAKSNSSEVAKKVTPSFAATA